MTFGDELGEVALKPGTGGIFEMRLDGERLWNKKNAGRFPEPKEIKQLIRDRVTWISSTATANERLVIAPAENQQQVNP